MDVGGGSIIKNNSLENNSLILHSEKNVDKCTMSVNIWYFLNKINQLQFINV